MRSWAVSISLRSNYVRRVIGGLKEINPDYVVPTHCTGEPFWDLARAEIPNKLLRAYTGTRFVFNLETAVDA